MTNRGTTERNCERVLARYQKVSGGAMTETDQKVSLEIVRKLRIAIHDLRADDRLTSPENPANKSWLNSVAKEDAKLIMPIVAAYGAAQYEAGAAQMRDRAAMAQTDAWNPPYAEQSKQNAYTRGRIDMHDALRSAVRALPLREKD